MGNDLLTKFAAKLLPEKLLKMTLLHMLLALDYLHTEVGIIHTGILTLFASNYSIPMCSL